MKLEELKALLEKATTGPWQRATIPGQREGSFPVESDWTAVTGFQGTFTELADPMSRDTELAIALRNAAPALIACAETLERIVGDRNAEIGAALENEAKAVLRALEQA